MIAAGIIQAGVFSSGLPILDFMALAAFIGVFIFYLKPALEWREYRRVKLKPEKDSFTAADGVLSSGRSSTLFPTSLPTRRGRALVRSKTFPSIYERDERDERDELDDPPHPPRAESSLQYPPPTWSGL